jgi:hypothetical protein
VGGIFYLNLVAHTSTKSTYAQQTTAREANLPTIFHKPWQAENPQLSAQLQLPLLTPYSPQDSRLLTRPGTPDSPPCAPDSPWDSRLRPHALWTGLGTLNSRLAPELASGLSTPDSPQHSQLSPGLSTPNFRLAPVDSRLTPRLLTHARGLSSRPLSATLAPPSALSRNCGDPFSTLLEFLTSLTIHLRADLCSPT